MSRFPLLLLSLVLLSTGVAQPRRSTLLGVTSVPTSPAAAAMLAELDAQWHLLGPQPSEYWSSKTNTEIARIREDAEQRIVALTEQFAREHPDDPLRWEAVLKASMMSGPTFITGFKPGLDNAPKDVPRTNFYVIDEAAKEAWKVRQAQYADQLRTAPDVPWEVREYRLFIDIAREVRNAAKEGPGALGAAEKKIDVFAQRFPEGRQSLALYQSLFAVRFREGAAAAEETWGRLSASPNHLVAERARAELNRFEATRKPLELAFTAVDGRKVDLAELRGKVVLVDFWATWCAPCIAELPNVKKVYAAYHEKGFEVIGISLENPRYAKDDTAAQHAEKLARASKVLTDFTAKNEMPWPQYFDGEWWQNPIARKHAVNAIPAMFLVGPDGRVVSTNARGEKLEQEVKRLLQK